MGKPQGRLPSEPVKIGEKFGKWEVIEEPFRYKGRWRVLVRCECGNTTKEQDQYRLVYGHTNGCRSCGGRKRGPVEPGDRFGSLTVVKEDGRRNGKVMWTAVCDCEDKNEIRVTTSQLRCGITTRCVECSYKARMNGAEGTVWHVIRSGATSRDIPLEITWE